MSAKTPFTCRGVRTRKRSAAAALIAMLASTFSGTSLFTPVVHAQSAAPVSQGFPLDAGDLRFIYEQIQVAQAHAAGGTLSGTGPFQVSDPQLPRGLRTVDGSFNNLVPGQTHFGQADLKFPRLTTPVFRTAETLPFDPDGAGPQAAGQATSSRPTSTPAARADSSAAAAVKPTPSPALSSSRTSRRTSACRRRSTWPLRSSASSSTTGSTS